MMRPKTKAGLIVTGLGVLLDNFRYALVNAFTRSVTYPLLNQVNKRSTRNDYGQKCVFCMHL